MTDTQTVHIIIYCVIVRLHHVRDVPNPAIPVISIDGIHDVFIGEGTMNGEHLFSIQPS